MKRQGLATVSREAPVLIAGPTASGKSALAMELAARDDRVVVNADALQVYANWRVLTARPSVAEIWKGKGIQAISRSSCSTRARSLGRPNRRYRAMWSRMSGTNR